MLPIFRNSLAPRGLRCYASDDNRLARASFVIVCTHKAEMHNTVHLADTNLIYFPSCFINGRLNTVISSINLELYASPWKSQKQWKMERRRRAFLYFDFASSLEFHFDDWFKQIFHLTLNITLLWLYIYELI